MASHLLNKWLVTHNQTCSCVAARAHVAFKNWISQKSCGSNHLSRLAALFFVARAKRSVVVGCKYSVCIKLTLASQYRMLANLTCFSQLSK